MTRPRRDPATPSRSLERGDLLPLVAGDDSGHGELARRLGAAEAPGINTLVDGATDLVLDEALGANVTDTRGRRYIDLVGGFGVAILGHRHPAVVAAVRRQADRLLHGLGDVYAHPPRIALAEALLELAPRPDSRVYFAVSGADAVEVALKTAVLATGRRRVLAFDPGYHGLTLGALQVSSRPAFREPFAGHAGDHVLRLPFASSRRRIEEVLSRGDVAAVLFEPVVGREGVVFPPAGWLADLDRAARAHGALTIADEIFTGMRRTGPWFGHTDEMPDGADLICCGKALGGGLPIGAVIGPADRMSAWTTDGEALHTGTFVAHPLACAAGLAVLDELGRPELGRRIARIAEALAALHGPLAEAGIGLRGRGLLWGLVHPSRAAAGTFRGELLRAGLLTLAGGPAGNVVQLVPPAVLSEQQLDYVVHTIRAAAAELAPR